MAYLGELPKAVDYFAALGHACPPNFNPADFFIEELAVVPSDYEKSMARLRVVTDAYQDSDLRKQNEKWLSKVDPAVLSKPRRRTGIAITEYPATADTQFWESCRRTILQYKREPVLTRARLVNSILMGVLLGLVYFDQDTTYKAVQNKIGVAFIVTMNQCISATFGVVQEVPRDFAVFMREYLAGANRVSSYFLARTLSEIPFQILFPLVFGSIVYGMVGLRPTAGAYITFCLVLILCANTAVSMGYALSAVFRNTTAAIAAGSVVIMPMALFSGLLLDMDNIAPWLRPLQFLSIIRCLSLPPSLPRILLFLALPMFLAPPSLSLSRLPLQLRRTPSPSRVPLTEGSDPSPCLPPQTPSHAPSAFSLLPSLPPTPGTPTMPSSSTSMRTSPSTAAST